MFGMRLPAFCACPLSAYSPPTGLAKTLVFTGSQAKNWMPSGLWRKSGRSAKA